MFITTSSVAILLLASVLMAVPSLRQHASSTGARPISEGDGRIYALALAQSTILQPFLQIPWLSTLTISYLKQS
jgi:hypothetical protein